MKSVFTVAYRGTFGEFMGLYRVGDEKRVRWGKSLFIEAISNVDPAQRYPMCEFLLDRECVLNAGTKDGTNPFHILFAQRAHYPGFDAQLTGSHDTVYDVARRWPHRQALADRIATHLGIDPTTSTQDT